MDESNDRLGQESLGKQKLSTLVKNLAAVAPQLVRDEVALAKNELKETGQKASVGAGLFGGAGVFAIFGAIALLIALIFGLSLVMPNWLAAIVAAAIFFVIAGIAALLGKKSINKAFKQNTPGEVVHGFKYDAKIMREGSSASQNAFEEAKDKTANDIVKVEDQKAEKPLTTAELKKRIEAQRDYLGETVDGLGYKLDFEARGKELLSDTTETVQKVFKETTKDIPEKLDELKDASAQFVKGREKPLATLGASATAFGLMLKRYLKKKKK